MAKCTICSKINNVARKHRYRGTQVTKRSLRIQKPNVHKMKALIDGRKVRLNVCTRCVRSNFVNRAS